MNPAPLSRLTRTWRTLALSLLLFGCGGQASGGTDGSTHWLKACSNDAQCSAGLDCMCGACTKPCANDGACSELSQKAVCQGVRSACGEPAETTACTLQCVAVSECGPGVWQCVDGQCTDGTLQASGTEGTNLQCGAMNARSSGDECLELDGFAWNGAQCEPVYCGCIGEDCGGLYETLTLCNNVFAPCHTSAPYEFCQNASDCGEGQSCLAGTCGDDCSNYLECGDDRRCFAEEGENLESCLLTVVDVGGPGGQCLWPCQTDADCEQAGTGLSCWASGCVRMVPECQTRCPAVASSCDDACVQVLGLAVDPTLMCRVTEPVVLGCTPAGRLSTSDDNCIVSPDGVIYDGISGTHPGPLVRQGGFTQCSAEQRTISSGAAACAP